MKKTTLINMLLILIISNCYAQSVTTNNSKSNKSNFCGVESFTFTLQTDKIVRSDNYYNKTEVFYSRMNGSEFTDEGFYLEILTPGFFLEENGIDEYYSIKKKLV